ncbi:MAG: CapA family protein [Xanthomonadales bacterium]|jgi:poly-gamma-glutamate capsule biosynthesis protein CapA/YwtB (metallophosphatase superfamily)|nr:CapA family protein [Xanthomonadales bacterium]
MNRLAALTATLLFVFGPSTRAGELSLSGRVLDEKGAPLAGASIDVNGQPAIADPGGTFRVTVGEAGLYALTYSAEDHFPAIHSYSSLELSWSGDDGEHEVPDVTLVKRQQGRVMMAFGGDAMMGRRFSEPYIGEPVLIRAGHEAEDTKALLRHMKPYLKLADFATVNLETQVMKSRPEGKAPKSYVFFTPPEAVAALRDAGVDYVTLGNNHTNDFLAAGLSSTLNSLTAIGMPYSGAGLNENDALRPYRVEVGQHPYSFLGYVGWAGNFSPNQVAEGVDDSGAAFGTSKNIKLTVSREINADRLPVVQYHGSREYTDEPTLVTETRLKQAIDDGAVLAIAHHPHVTQGFEIYQGRLIAYSLGNFIFDQYHYATQYSYMIYVWMDGGRFHRAELVPIHIQGYTPMPATDTVRLKVLKRTQELSARRGIAMGQSGGNGVIFADGGATEAGVLDIPETAGITSFNRADWSHTITSIKAADGKRVRLGKNMLPTGHFENYALHGSPDRSWIEDGRQSVIRDDDGNHVMSLLIPAGEEEGEIGMRIFEYTFEPGTPSSFIARARPESAVTVTAYQQWRGSRDNRLEALLENPLRPIGSVELEAGEWQDLRFDFDSPRVSAISYRIVLRVAPKDSTRAHTSWFDDIALIEWLTPALSAGDLPPQVAAQRTSHLDVIKSR